MSKSVSFSMPTPARNGQDAVEEFAAAADVHHTPRRPKAAAKSGQPDWLAMPHDREVNILNVRLTDREKEAVKWLAERSPDSMHTICKRGAMAEINRLLREAHMPELGPAEK